MSRGEANIPQIIQPAYFVHNLPMVEENGVTPRKAVGRSMDQKEPIRRGSKSVCDGLFRPRHCAANILEVELRLEGKKSRTVENQKASMVSKLKVAELFLSGIVMHP